MSELSRKRSVRAGHKGSATRMMSKVDNLMAEDTPDPAILSRLKLSLNEKLDVLKQLDGEILALIEEGEVGDEILRSDEFKDGIFAAIIKIDRVLASKTSPTTVPTAVLPATPATPKVKLPKLMLKPFDITAWNPFLDSFKAGIHDNTALSDVDKFNYLKGPLQRAALDAISGLSLTGANYREAVSILEKIFGNKPQIISKHMDTLPVSSPNNVKGLRHLYDIVESNIRSLKSLGVESTSYGTLLANVLINKIPQEIQLVLSRKTGSEDWRLDTLMGLLGEELEARERTSTVAGSTTGKKQGKEPYTAEGLFAGASAGNKLTCSYCLQDHPSNSCGVVVQPQARKQVLQRTG